MTQFLISFGMREKMPLFEVWVSPVLAQNLDIWNFHGSLVLNNGTMTHVQILFGMKEKMAGLNYVFLPVLKQNQDIWNFHGSLTLNNGKLIDVLETLAMLLCQI